MSVAEFLRIQLHGWPDPPLAVGCWQAKDGITIESQWTEQRPSHRCLLDYNSTQIETADEIILSLATQPPEAVGAPTVHADLSPS